MSRGLYGANAGLYPTNTNPEGACGDWYELNVDRYCGSGSLDGVSGGKYDGNAGPEGENVDPEDASGSQYD